MAYPTRKSKNKEIPKEIYIYTEGKETEVLYFNALKQQLKLHNLKVKVKGVGKSSTSLITHAAGGTKNREDIESVWVVFDKDSLTNDDLQASYTLAKRNSIEIAFSNCNFEVWLLLHFEKLLFPSACDSNLIYTKLGRHLSVEKYEKHKSDNHIIQGIVDKYKFAIKNNFDLLKDSTKKNVAPYTDIVYLIQSLIR